jgi:hypothetical protein
MASDDSKTAVRSDGVSVKRLSQMTREDTMTDWIQLIRAEYHEIPGLHLTKPQVQRLWNLDTSMCEAVLQALEAARFLRRTHSGAYVKA